MKKQTGFTLIELLVSIAIMLFLLVVLSATSIGITNMWQRGIAHNERRQSATFAFQKIIRDLRAAVVSINPAKKSAFFINHPKIGPTYTNPQTLFFEGEMDIYGYFVQWVDRIPILTRLRVPKGATINDKLIEDNAPSTKNSGYLGLLAENILGLWVQPIDGKTAAIITKNGVWDASDGYVTKLEDWRLIEIEIDDPDDTHIPPRKIKSWKNVFQGIKNYTFYMPAAVRIAMVVVDARTVKKLTDADKPKGPISDNDAIADAQTYLNNLREPIRRGANIYSATVFLPTGPK